MRAFSYPENGTSMHNTIQTVQSTYKKPGHRGRICSKQLKRLDQASPNPSFSLRSSALIRYSMRFSSGGWLANSAINPSTAD